MRKQRQDTRRLNSLSEVAQPEQPAPISVPSTSVPHYLSGRMVSIYNGPDDLGLLNNVHVLMTQFCEETLFTNRVPGPMCS